MSKLTKYTAPIASIDSMGFPLQTERIIYLASDVDAYLATQGEEIERLTYCVQVHADVLGETVHKHEQHLATLQAELEAMTRKRDLLKNAYDVLSTDSDELLSRNTRLEQQLAAREGQLETAQETERFLRDTPWLQRVKELEEALKETRNQLCDVANGLDQVPGCVTRAIDNAQQALKPSA